MGFGEEYYGMSDREILIEQCGELKAMKNMLEALEAKPCPSPQCLECRRDLLELKAWKLKREVQLEAQDNADSKKLNKAAWFWPMVAATAVAIVALFLEAAFR